MCVTTIAAITVDLLRGKSVRAQVRSPDRALIRLFTSILSPLCR